MRNHGIRTKGFTLLEVLLASTFASFVMLIVAVSTMAYRDSIRISGVEELGGAKLPISPDDSARSASLLMGAELLSVANQSNFAIVANGYVDADGLLALQQVPGLRSFPVSTLKDPLLASNALRSLGYIFAPGGFTVFFYGSNFRLTGVLRARDTSAIAADGANFIVYNVDLYGDSISGFGLLYNYSFCSYAESSAPVILPVEVGNSWSIILPDPGVRDNWSSTESLTSLTYAVPTGL